MEIQAILTPTPIILQIQDAEEIYSVYFWLVYGMQEYMIDGDTGYTSISTYHTTDT